MRTVLAAAILLAFASLAAGCRAASSIKDARTVTVEGAFTFKIPGDMSGVDAQGIDSIVGRFSSPAMELDYDYGAQAGPLGNDSKPEFKITLLTVDGREATIERFVDTASNAALPLVAAIHFEDTGDGNGLTMYTRCVDEDAQDLAVDIFRTIKFIDPKS
jgi:hypothetical protein